MNSSAHFAAVTAVVVAGLALVGLDAANEAHAEPWPLPQWCPGDFWTRGGVRTETGTAVTITGADLGRWNRLSQRLEPAYRDSIPEDLLSLAGRADLDTPAGRADLDTPAGLAGLDLVGRPAPADPAEAAEAGPSEAADPAGAELAEAAADPPTSTHG